MWVRLAALVLGVSLVAGSPGGPIPADGALARPQPFRGAPAKRSGVQPPDPHAVEPPRSGWRPRPGWGRDRPETDVPEAGTLVLVGLGLLVLPVLVRRRRRAKR